METITGTVASLHTFARGWAIVGLRNEHRKITGTIPGTVKAGDSCRFTGAWTSHPKYGEQFTAEKCEVLAPTEERSIREYLVRHLPGVGPAVAKALFDAHGDDIFDIIEDDPDELSKARGITETKAHEIHAAYMEIRHQQALDIFCEAHGIGPGTKGRITEAYGPESALHMIERNPYGLIDNIDGIGWKKADGIAMSLGVNFDSLRRRRAGLEYVLKEAAQSGHCYLPESMFWGESGRILGYDVECIIPERCRVDLVDGKAMLQSVAGDEERVGELIKRMV